jgi:hypothetical protein
MDHHNLSRRLLSGLKRRLGIEEQTESRWWNGDFASIILGERMSQPSTSSLPFSLITFLALPAAFANRKSCTSMLFLGCEGLNESAREVSISDFAFQFVNPLCLSVISSAFRWRQTAEYFILPSLVLLCAEALQFGFVLFRCHDGPSLSRRINKL